MRTLLFALLLSACALPLAAADKPNVVLLLADDLGWGDISVHDGGVPTPHIDRLFSQGVELTQYMGWCVCSPTRAMLLTGRHPFRVGTGPEVGGELAVEETTVAEAFRAQGYRTGVFGKWHNGDDPDTPEYRKAFAEAFPDKAFQSGHGVNAHGFDEAWIYYGGGGDYFNRRTVQGRGPVSWWHNREFRGEDEGYTDDLVARRAIEFIAANKDQPFFCYVPFHLVHAPLQAKDEDLAEIDPKMAAKLPAAKSQATAEGKHIHAAMVHALDKNVAAILAALDEHGLRDNTIVIFTSDNGAMEAGSSLPLRGSKHSIYEGGVRLPTVVRWPQGGLVGGAQWEGLCGALDLFPTLIAMAGLEMPATRPLDGKNVWPALRERRPASPVDSYYWSWRDEDSIRTAAWKLHRFSDRFELYDMQQDPHETQDVSGDHPETVAALTAKMDAWVESLGAALTHRPRPNPKHAAAAPEGDVLMVRATVTEEAKRKDLLLIPFAVATGRVVADDWLEFDIAFAPQTPQPRPYCTPFKGEGKPNDLYVKRGVGVDQLGRPQIEGPSPQEGKLVWEHRVIGLCSFAPGPAGRQGIVITGRKPGDYVVYLDNLRIRHGDGTVTDVWTRAQDTRHRPIADSKSFRTIEVQAVPAPVAD